MTEFQTGLYKHFKGNEYLAIGTALDSETQMPFVLYKPFSKESVSFWIRPQAMFLESVTTESGVKKRFTLLRALRAEEILSLHRLLFKLDHKVDHVS